MIILQYFSKYYTRIIFMFVFIAAMFFSVSNYNKSYHHTLKITENIKTVDSAVVKITSFPVFDGERITFEGKVTNGEQKELLGAYYKVYFNTAEDLNLYPGDFVIVKGNRQSPSPVTNIGGFDGVSYCKSENNHGNIFAKEVKIFSKSKSSFITDLHKLRQNFIEKSDKYFDPQYAGVVKALVSGDKSSIYESDSTSLKKSGVYHIVAISGLHLNIFIMVFSKFIASLKMKRMKKAILAAVICTLVGLFVLLFTGFGLSVIRAFVMLVISLGSAVFGRKYSSKNSLLMSFIIIVILIPSSFFNVGFRLSVLSTYGVLLSGSILNKLKEKEFLKTKASTYVAGTFVTSVTCMVLTLPVTMNSFGYISVYSPFANMIILPLMAPALGGCVIFGIPAILGYNCICKLISYPVNMLVFTILNSAKLISSAPFSTLNTYPAYTLWLFVCALIIAIGVYLLIKSKRKLALFTALVLCVANASVFMYNNNVSNAKVVFADVEQGDCAIVVLPGRKAAMFDFGTNSNIYYSVSEIKSTLIKLNISKISAAFVSHFHKDHILGIIELVGEGLIQKVYVPEYYDEEDYDSEINRRQLLAVCQKTGTPITKIYKGDLVTLGDAKIEVITPTKEMDYEANAMSAVIKMTYGDVKFLFTGDISKDGIKHLYNSDIDCDILKVPHHGSKNSADETFIKMASPEYAVISCSESNSYGHPHEETLKLLNDNDAKIFRTDKMGAIIFNINKESIKSVETMR